MGCLQGWGYGLRLDVSLGELVVVVHGSVLVHHCYSV